MQGVRGCGLFNAAMLAVGGMRVLLLGVGAGHVL